MQGHQHINDSIDFTQEELEKLNEWELTRLVDKYLGNRGIFPRGVYRFRTHEEANEWDKQCMIKALLNK